MMMEMMGRHLPGAAFVNPNTPLRDALTAAAPKRAVEIRDGGNDYTPMSGVVDAKSLVNALAGLLATGGATNHPPPPIPLAPLARRPLAPGGLHRPPPPPPPTAPGLPHGPP